MTNGTNNDERAAAYWRANRRLIVIMLVIWALVPLGAGVLFVEPLNRFNIGTLPFGFWMAQQGSIIIFVIMIFVYAKLMDRIDHKFRYDTEEDPSKNPDKYEI